MGPKAVAYAIDREAINKMVKFGMATVLAGGVLPETHWAYADLHMYAKPDVDKAKQLLAEAGLQDGFKTVLKVGSDFEYQVQAAQIIKQQLKAIGIEVEVSGLESGIFFDALGNHDFELTVVGWALSIRMSTSTISFIAKANGISSPMPMRNLMPC